MVIYTEKVSLANALFQRRNANPKIGQSRTIGFVPTMGALHKGHLALIESALKENDTVVVSIFVNPTQFNNPIDLEKYPRTPKNDLSLLQDIADQLIVYLPEISDIYGEAIVSNHYDFGNLEKQMEGKHRKGHFDGVGTVLNKLFRIINPDKAYFGEKDFQQLQIVKKLVEIENLPIQIVGCPIVREENGLAMSSRNSHLTPEQFEEASFIYKILREVKEKFASHSIQELNRMVAERFLQNQTIELEYFEIAEEKSLRTAKRKDSSLKYRAFVAAFIGNIRLIDNIPLN